MIETLWGDNLPNKHTESTKLIKSHLARNETSTSMSCLLKTKKHFDDSTTLIFIATDCDTPESKEFLLIYKSNFHLMGVLSVASRSPRPINLTGSLH